MKTKTLLVLTVLAAAIPSFALPPPNIPNPRKHQKGFSIKWRPPHTEHAYSPSPSSGMATAVAISGIIAAGLRMLEEATQTPTVPVIVTTPSSNCEVVLPPELQKASAPPVIVIPEDAGITEVHVVPMEPVVKHPVPISVLPMEIMSVR